MNLNNLAGLLYFQLIKLEKCNRTVIIQWEGGLASESIKLRQCVISHNEMIP
jgi:hypothetical protein